MMWRARLLVVAALAIASTACVNWEAVERAQSAELEAMRAWTENVGPLLEAPSGNAGEAAHVAYQVRMAYVGQTLKQMQPDTLATVLSYAKAQNELWFRGLSLALNNQLTGALAQRWIGKASSGGNEFNFGGDDAENSFSGFQFTTGNQSPYVDGNENAVAAEDGQIMDGEGNTQGQVITRPLNQNDLDFAGDGGSGEGGGAGGSSDNNIDSEGLGAEL